MPTAAPPMSSVPQPRPRCLWPLPCGQSPGTHVQGVRLNHTILASTGKKSRKKRCFFSIWHEGVDKNVPMQTEMWQP